jgi:hypothetical protein
MLRYPNAISMYLQSYGNQFVTDGGKRKTREEVEAEKASGIRPFKFNVFHQVAREVNNRLDYFQESTDYEMIISLLNNFVLNNTFEQQTIITLASSLREKCNEEILEKLHTNKIFTLAKNLRFIKLHYGDDSFEEYELVVRSIADRHRETQLKREESGDAPESREHSSRTEDLNLIKSLLTEIVGGPEKFVEDHYLEGPLTSVKLFVPESSLAIELTNQFHYYPYSSKLNNIVSNRNRMIYLHNNRILSINSRYMDKYKENDNQGLKQIIERAILGKKEIPAANEQ